VFQPDHQTRTAPNLNVVTVNQPFGLGDGLAIVAAGERYKPYDMPVVPDDVGQIFDHMMPLLPRHLALLLSTTFRELIALSDRFSFRAISVRSIFLPEASHHHLASTVDQSGMGLSSFRFLTLDGYPEPPGSD
jgi:hypothetical protein